MLWLLLFLLLSALGVLWWRFAMPTAAGNVVAPPVLAGNHPSLRTRHYRLADFHPAPVVVPPIPEPAAAAEPPADSPEEVAVEEVAAEPSPAAMEEPALLAPKAGQLPERALHNYLKDPAPTATDEHNRGVELTAAERRAKMRAVMSAAVENRRAAPATT